MAGPEDSAAARGEDVTLLTTLARDDPPFNVEDIMTDRAELLRAIRREGERRYRWRVEWEAVSTSPKRWAFLRELYREITPEILANELSDPYVVDWMRVFTPIEYDMWCSIRALAIPMWPQYPVGGFFIDFGDPARHIAFEADGQQWHHAEKDAKRDAELRSLGWSVFRFPGWQCVRGEGDETSAHERLIDIARSYYPRA